MSIHPSQQTEQASGRFYTHNWTTEQISNIFKGVKFRVSDYSAVKVETDNKRITRKPLHKKSRNVHLNKQPKVQRRKYTSMH